ncbi:MAG TPA: guanylate kinase [Chitinophagaceae bacterium]|nr:guanylate kinase [Chitinophagaceae bacterium]
MKKPLIIITAPSGSGKTTIARHLLSVDQRLEFSVSACTRPPRPTEKEGRDYYFMSPETFRKKIEEGAFAEYEMVYADKYYGTPLAGLERIWNSGKVPLLDIDIQGARSLKKRYGADCHTIFIKLSSSALREARLRSRGTETPEMLRERINRKAEQEVSEKEFDRVLVNDDLDHAKKAAEGMVDDFLREHASGTWASPNY